MQMQAREWIVVLDTLRCAHQATGLALVKRGQSGVPEDDAISSMIGDLVVDLQEKLGLAFKIQNAFEREELAEARESRSGP